jgi:2',3'-cyclic-nucleotide 2'-phosphodiesterase (5'-nucleotidase family)
MLRKLRPRSVYDVFAALALFVALGGTSAYAIDEWNSSNIQNETLLSEDIKNGTLIAQDYGIGSVSGARIQDNNVTTLDLADGAIFGNDIRDGELSGADVGDGSLTGADVDESTLASLDASDDFDASCNPSSTTFVNCDANPMVTLGRPMPVLVTLSVHFASVGTTDPARGNCRLMRDNAPVSTQQPIGELVNNTAPGAAQQVGMQLTDVQNLGAGISPYTFGASCNETAGNIEFRDIYISVVELAHD